MNLKVSRSGFTLLIALSILPLCLNAQDLDGRAGDQVALEALYNSANGSGWNNNSGWSSSGMSLSDNIYGITTSTIGGELRVTEINLNDNNLTGNINVPEIGNLKRMKLFAVTFNRLNSTLPPQLGNATSLEYLYLSRSDDVGSKDVFPHEEAATGGGDVHPGKNKGSERNIFRGEVPSSWGNLSNLKWFVLNWTDSTVDATDGISSISPELFDITTFEGLQIYNNNGIADLPFPSGIVNMSNLDNLALGVGKSGRNTGFLTGTVPSGFGNLSNLRFLRIDENPELILDFDIVDPSGWTSMRNLILADIILEGNFPDALLDGSLPDLIGIDIAFPENGGFTGQLSSGSTNMEIIIVYGNNLSGSIPAGIWDNIELINTNFSYNNFTSIGTDDLTQLGQNYWKIRNLRWSHNEITGRWPNLAWGTTQLEDLSRVQFDNNRYVFSDMLWVPSEYNPSGKTIFELYKDHGLSSFQYGDQKPFGSSATRTVSAGGTLSIDNFENVVTHPDNVYQWEKDGSAISGATNRNLTLSNALSLDEGTYRLVVTNPGVPNLTLSSEPIEVYLGAGGGNPPNAPSLASPANGATGQATSLTLDWNSSSGADSYQLQVGTETNFSSTYFDENGLTSTSQEITGLDNSRTYYWRVQASNQDGSSSWSNTRSFTTVESPSGNPPNAPSLASPANEATGQAVSLTLDWNSSSGADSYQLQVGTGTSFSSTYFDDSGLTATSQEIAGLDNSQTYYWRVKASNQDGSSSWSTTRNFTTIESSADILPAPVQTSPADQSDNVSVTPVISWEPVEGADHYILHLDSPDNGPGLIVEAQVTESQYEITNELEPGRIHKWRVHAVKDSVAGEWSPIWAFTTASSGGGSSGSATTITYSNGWNLVSIPRNENNILFEDIFTDIVPSSIYSFDGTYTSDSKLVPGKGYWIKLLSGQQAVFEGADLVSLDLSLESGWNLIGAPMSSTDVQTEISDPNNIIEQICRPIGEISSGFNCEAVTSLEPGKAYFVKARNSGNIILN